MRQFLVEISNEGEEEIDSWVETLNGENEQAPYNIIERFNLTLRLGEKKRVVLGITEVKDAVNLPHNWEKSCLVTQTKGGIHDTYKCSECGITGKRFNLASYVIVDKKYDAKKYQYCKR